MVSMKLINKIKNQNAAAKRTRAVCYGYKKEFENINFGSEITLAHGPDYKDDHNVINVFADGVLVGNIIHKKLKGDKLANIYNNDEIINMIVDGMVVNLVKVKNYQLIIDIPSKIKRFI